MDAHVFKKELETVTAWLGREFQALRTGHATPAVLDGVSLEAYGVPTPLSRLASISLEGPQTLLVSPYDSTQVKGIEKAVSEAGLGLSVVAGEKGIRVIFPDLTTERRELLIKLAKEKLEQARVSVRQERDRVWQTIQEEEQLGEISEDEKFAQKARMEEMVQEANQGLAELYQTKEQEIRD